MLKSSFFEGSSTENEKVLKVTKIQKVDLDTYFYIKLSNVVEFKDFEEFILEYNNLEAPVISSVNTETPENQIWVSQILANSLSLKIGDLVKLKQAYAVKTVKKVDIVIENSTAQALSLELQRALKALLTFCYTPKTLKFDFKGYSFTLKSDREGQIIGSTIFMYPQVQLNSINLQGYSKVYSLLNQILNWPITHKGLYKKLKLHPAKGVLLYGPPGTGKTYILKEVLKNNPEYKVFVINCTDVLSKYTNESEEKLRKVFEQASKQPSIILLDEFDVIAHKRSSYGSDHGEKVVSQLISSMDGLRSRDSVVVIATTNLISSIDPALRRPGRFDYEIEIGAPSELDKLNILNGLLPMQNISNSIIRTILDKSKGFVAADLKALCNEIKLNIIRRVRQDNLKLVSIELKDVEQAFSKVQPSMLREYNISTTTTTLDQIIGYEEVKKKMYRELDYALRFRSLFEKLQMPQIRGVLLYGPPGTGKTSLAKSVAKQLDYNFMTVLSTDLVHCFVGESEKALKAVFEKAKLAQPCVIFIDEIDSLLGKPTYVERNSTSSFVNLFQSYMDGILKKTDQIVVIATTNQPEKIPKAFFRPGRFDLVLEMKVPTYIEKKALFKYYFKGLVDPNFEFMGRILNFAEANNFTGADIAGTKRQAFLKKFSRSSPEQIKKYLQAPLSTKFTEDEIYDAVKTVSTLIPNFTNKALHYYGP